jgi:hypothetical protein
VSKISLSIGLDVLRSYRRLAYTPWYALAEFVDNSTQSYFDNKKVLDAAYATEGRKLEVTIEYDRAAGELRIRDTAMGMSLDDLRAAVHVGKPPANTSGRSQFGLGMKTAAGWFGDLWSVRTKKLGEEVGHEITVDVDKIVNESAAALPYASFKSTKGDHFTEITVRKLHQVLQGRRLAKTKEFLRSMYRVDARTGVLTLMWGDERLGWDEKLALLQDPPGHECRQEVKFSVGAREVVGWAGVLAPGYTGRSSAGFAIVRRGRLVRGWPEPWRPEAVFGPYEGSNDLVNQRVTGEFHFDEFDVTHTKDDILFEDDEEDLVQDSIRAQISDVIEKARTYRQRPSPEPKSQQISFEAAIKGVGLDVRMSSVRKSLELLSKQKAKSEAVAVAFGALAARAAKGRDGISVVLAEDARLRVVISENLSADEPYAVVGQTSTPEWLVVVNAAHPVCDFAATDAAMHFIHLVTDHAALWAAQRLARPVTPSSWIALKDALLRSIAGDE